MNEQFWTKNRRGECAMCGVTLGFYDSKWIEKQGERIVCGYSPPNGCGARDLGPGVWRRDSPWYYYTDG